MTQSLSALKKSSSVDKLAKALESAKASTQGVKKDERFWQPEVDKAGNGYAVIRFLDAPFVDGEDSLPFAQVWSHAFQGPGGWYIENSLTTLGRPDPVSEYNTKLWNSGIEANKDIARKQKRKLTYISNILVVDDPQHPENNGKVFLFKYGKKIFDKIQEALNPQFKDETKVNVFNFWEGANFKLKIRQVEGYRNYDKSEFAAPSPVAAKDAEIEAIWKKAHSLKEFVAETNFKPYEELKARLNRVLGATSEGAVEASPSRPSGRTAEALRAAAASDGDATTPNLAAGDSEEEGLDRFSQLLEDDN